MLASPTSICRTPNAAWKSAAFPGSAVAIQPSTMNFRATPSTA